MKWPVLIFSVACSMLAACTEQGKTQSVSDLMLVDDGNTPAKCTVKDITDCTTSAGGLSCFSRCGFQPSDKFCALEALDKCLDSKGGNGCYVKHCNASVHSGLFAAPKGEGLVKLPAQGYGYETFDVEWMRYGKPRTVARVQELAIRVYNKTGKKLFIGDLSSSSGGNGGRHAGHYEGVEVDIAVMGNTPAVHCYTIYEGCYLRSASVVLINEIIKMGGATGVLFNDPSVRAKFPGFVSYAGGHDNHYHVSWQR